MKEKVKNQGLASLIKYEGTNDTFVWKHPIEDFNLGSQLIVHESQEAIFFRDGKALDLFGAGRYTLSTQNIPLLENLYKLPTNSDEVFHSEVYFINLTTQMGIKWGTDSKVRLFDPASGLHIELGAFGNFSLRVADSRKLLIKLVGTQTTFKQNDVLGDTYSIKSVVGNFKALVMNKVKANLARIIKDNNINILEVDEYIDVISEKLRTTINETLVEYGLFMPEFFVTNIATPDDDPNFQRLKQQFAEKTLRVRDEQVLEAQAQAAQSRKLLEAQTQAQLRMVEAQGQAEAMKIKAMAEAESYRQMAFAQADEMKAKGYTYQQESSRLVGLEAMQNGIGGDGASSALGDVASLGLSLGAMGGVINMTKDALSPMMQTTTNMGSQIISNTQDTWNCSCGCSNITTKFCPECGNKKPEANTWNCSCGCSNITTKFCPECGSKKPEANTWNCSCGAMNITSKFCPECGNKKPEVPTTWNCPQCGNKDIKTKFCPECGYKKEG